MSILIFCKTTLAGFRSLNSARCKLKKIIHFLPSLIAVGLSLVVLDAHAARNCSAYGVWVTGTSYSQNQFVQYNGKAYQCKNQSGCTGNNNKTNPETGSDRSTLWNYLDTCLVISSSSSSSLSSSSSSSRSSSSSLSSSSSSSRSSSSSLSSSSSSSSLSSSSSSRSSSSVSSTSSSSSSSSSGPAQDPLFLASAVKPHIALVMSIDQELTKKAYSDYSNLDGGILSMSDTTYRNDFTYYGYFDSNWCYTYDSSNAAANLRYFTPHVAASNHQCSGSAAAGTDVAIDTAGAWSGNFLNWVSMTRMDILRRVLFGGKRSVDTTSQTILERAYIPSDVHAFVKVYGGADIRKYTPYGRNSGHEYRSFCNVSTSSDNTGYPVIRTAAFTEGYYFWAAREGTQCTFGGASAPAAGDVVTAKVDVCVTGKDTERCKTYGTSTLKKPFGLLQKHGETAAVNFSLTTGTYKAHLKGGVLRKAASTLVDGDNVKHGDADDEINLDDGTFNYSVAGIIQNINSFKVANYNSANRNYSDCNTHSISISTVLGGTTDGRTCTDWGNPIAETYLELLRYISGSHIVSALPVQNQPTTGFVVDDSTNSGSIIGVGGLTHVSTWTDPWADYCAKCAAIIISTGSNSFDSDDLSSASDIVGLSTGAAAVRAKTDLVGEKEYAGAFAGNYFMGLNATSYAPFTATAKPAARNCTSTSVDKLSDVSGVCPELPALEGSYNIAGLSYHAHITDLRPNLAGDQKLTTYAVDLAESLPVFSIPVGGNTVTFSPACEASPGTGFQSCTLANAVVEDLQFNAGNLVSGRVALNWEDSTWGNDYDLDAAQRISFCVGAACNPSIAAGKIQFISTTPYAAAGNEMHLSYSIYGVSHMEGGIYTGTREVSASGVFTRDGVAISAANTNTIARTAFGGGLVTPWTVRPGGQDYTTLAGAGSGVQSSKLIFDAAASSTKTLKKPLWFAAKFGGFVDSNKNGEFDAGDVWDARGATALSAADGVPDNFFSVKNPATLEDNLDAIITEIVARSGSASAVATASTRLSTDGYVYQAAFNSKDWTGELRGYQPNSLGVLPATPTKTTTNIVPTTNDMQTSNSDRNIYTFNGTSSVAFEWINLTAAQKLSLTLSGDVAGIPEKRVDWIKGSATDENNSSGFRERNYILNNAVTNVNYNYRNILGDIVNSSPVYEGAYDFKYSGLTTGGSLYKQFVLDKRARDPLVLVGANDGMLHAFKAKGTKVLREAFGYIPSFVFNKLPLLTKPNYGTASNPHQYFVDGNLVVGDAYITVGGITKWRSIVAASLGAGGKGIVVLDVTDVTDASPQPRVLFEYQHAEMGNVLGKMFILPTKAGRWALVFGNGDFTNTTSKLFMVDLESPSGTETKIINTAAGTGLSSPSVILNALGQLESVYAGDVAGNLWRFYYPTAASVTMSSYKVFAAQSGQPITAAPTIGYNDILKKYMVYFGTGRYYKIDDNLVGSQRQSFYAVPDMGPSGTPVVLTDLLQKTMNTNYTAGAETRRIPQSNPNWTTELGWFIDLDFDNGVRNERVISKALLLQDKLLITTLSPTSVACDVGGKSWFMEIPAVGDKYIGKHVVEYDSSRDPDPSSDPNDGDGHGKFENQIYLGDTNVSINTLGGGADSESSCGKSTNLALINSGTSGGALTVNNGALDACGTGRQSWRQLR